MFFGFDHEYSRTPEADPPVDILENGPDWLPWPRLEPAGEDLLGWCYWFNDGVWRRSPGAAAADLDDGHVAAAGDVLSDDQALAVLAYTVTGWDPPPVTAAPTPDEAAAAALPPRSPPALGRVPARPGSLAPGVDNGTQPS